MRVAIVDVAIAERSASTQVSADPHRHDLADLVEQIVKLRVGHILVQIPNVQRRRYELARSATGVGGDAVRSGHRRLMLNLNLSHHTKITKPSLQIGSLFKDFSVRVIINPRDNRQRETKVQWTGGDKVEKNLRTGSDNLADFLVFF